MRPSSKPRTALSAWLAVLALAGAAVLVIATTRTARAANISQLQQQISSGQNRINNLSGQVGAAQSRLDQLNGSIASLQKKLSGIQADLDAKRAQLIKLEVELNAARKRLAELQAMEARGEQILTQQVVNSYESDQPDLVNVVLESNGFQDLLERVQYVNRIQRQNTRVVQRVKRQRRAVTAQAVSLGKLEQHQQELTVAVLHERNSLAGVRVSLLRKRIAVAQLKDQKAGQLQSAKDKVSNLQDQLSKAQQAQAAQAAQAAGAPASATSGTPAGSSGGFTFPLPKDAASPPGTWSPDDGVDISAPGDAPEFAVCSGTIVLHGIGGFGPDAPVIHCDSPVGGYNDVYYGHAGPVNQLPVGTHVSAGQVMSSVGPGIVGISTGPHLEIGFCDDSGSPIGPGSAGAMMSLLQASYGG